ncbi:MAG: hypothetical protein HFI16_06200 [Lachnospiraceae bacterium]|nr:hypothetical protein [Lachnospiraceae bacterium]
MELSFIQDENAVELIDGITYEFPYTMHERDLSSYTVPWHWHEEVEFDYAYRGSILIETVNRTYTIRQGEAYFIKYKRNEYKAKSGRFLLRGGTRPSVSPNPAYRTLQKHI